MFGLNKQQKVLQWYFFQDPIKMDLLKISNNDEDSTATTTAANNNISASTHHDVDIANDFQLITPRDDASLKPTSLANTKSNRDDEWISVSQSSIRRVGLVRFQPLRKIQYIGSLAERHLKYMFAQYYKFQNLEAEHVNNIDESITNIEDDVILREQEVHCNGIIIIIIINIIYYYYYY